MSLLQALVGLSRSETVKQILGKLPVFNNGQLQSESQPDVFLSVCCVYVWVFFGGWGSFVYFVVPMGKVKSGSFP